MRHALHALLVLFVAALGACHAAAAPAPAICAKAPAHAAPAPAPVTDGMIDVGGGLSMHVHCMGDGTPLVVMDAGFGGSGTSWQLVQPDISRFTRVCVYDRLGAGYSDTPPKPHTVAQIVHELHALLDRAHLEGPYVLVGHSFGGLHVRRYASEYPGDVAGVVLVDASTAEQDQRFWSLLPAAAVHDMEEGLRTSREGVTMDTYRETMAFLRGDHPLGAVPLVVVTAGKSDDDDPVTPEVRAQMDTVWRDMQKALVGLSTNSAQVVAPDSHHFVQHDAPALVIAAVKEVVDAVRTRGRVEATHLSGAAK